MADLLDIVPAAPVETIEINGRPLTVRGLGLPAIASIVTRFPNSLAAWFIGGSIESLVPFGFAVPAIIAAGCDHLADEKYEKTAADMLPEDQIKVVAAIMRRTFPNGLNSFVETMAALFPRAGEGVKPVKVRLKKSPSPSPHSSDSASPPTSQ
jgi:hypothetical protein